MGWGHTLPFDPGSLTWVGNGLEGTWFQYVFFLLVLYTDFGEPVLFIIQRRPCLFLAYQTTITVYLQILRWLEATIFIMLLWYTSNKTMIWVYLSREQRIVWCSIIICVCRCISGSYKHCKAVILYGRCKTMWPVSLKPVSPFYH